MLLPTDVLVALPRAHRRQHGRWGTGLRVFRDECQAVVRVSGHRAVLRSEACLVHVAAHVDRENRRRIRCRHRITVVAAVAQPVGEAVRGMKLFLWRRVESRGCPSTSSDRSGRPGRRNSPLRLQRSDSLRRRSAPPHLKGCYVGRVEAADGAAVVALRERTVQFPAQSMVQTSV